MNANPGHRYSDTPRHGRQVADHVDVPVVPRGRSISLQRMQGCTSRAAPSRRGTRRALRLWRQSLQTRAARAANRSTLQRGI